MSRETRLIRRSRVAASGLVFGAVLCALFLTAQAAEAQTGRRANYGRIEISTTPGGFPLLINGQSAGVTTTYTRLVDLPPGRHTVEINFPNRRWVREVDIVAGRRECIALSYNPRTVSIPRSPCPYPVNVSAPATVNDGDVITFSADATYTGTSPLNYTWTVSPPTARIISGAGTPTISVDSTGLGRQRITAILVVDDGSGDRNCRQTAQASTNVLGLPPARVEPRRFDEFPSISFDDDKARLDNLVVELQNNPGSQAYIIAYGGRTSSVGQADRLGERARNYLVTVRGIEPNRIVIINGGHRERDTYEFWIVPQGAQAPQPTPSVEPSEVRPATDTRPRRPRRPRRR